MKIIAKTFCLLAFVAGTSAFAAETEFLHGLGDIRYHRSHAENIGRDFHIYVSLPADYEETGEDYPTIYLLDGGALLPMLAPYYRALAFGEDLPEAVVVGISYRGRTFEEGNYRSTDYTAPSAERDYWGGAENFQSYLKNQLLPFVESNYRTDPQRRVIFGQSIGGQFAIYTAMTMPDLFWGHIASNPAMHRNLDFYLDAGNFSESRTGDTRLFVGDASHDEPRFAEPRDQWVTHWNQVQDSPWTLQVEELAGHSHMSAPPASFRQGLRWLFLPQ